MILILLTLKILNSVNENFVTKIILIINSNNVQVINNTYKNLNSESKKNVINNFISCSDHIQIFLLLKKCKLFISNNKSLIHIYKFISKNNYLEVQNNIKKKFLDYLNNKNKQYINTKEIQYLIKKINE